jgi:V8-like Glu-specific endopeptidase
MNPRARRLLTSALVSVFASAASGQTAPLASVQVPVGFDSGFVEAPGDEPAVLWSAVVRVPQAGWLRLSFGEVLLTGDRGDSSLRLTSLHDGAVQFLDAVSAEQWRRTSAYFNGEAVLVELIAGAGSGPCRLEIVSATAGQPQPGAFESLCGADDRVSSTDPRAARLVPVGCTAFIIDDANHCFLSAGHCSPTGDTAQFNVPPSLNNCAIVHPPPEHQYAVDAASVQQLNGGIGNDWAYFGCFPNSNTGKTAFEAQGDFYALAASAPLVSGQTIRITGYGTDSQCTLSQTQQTSTGPYFKKTGTKIEYQVDTEGGNSGSAVINESDGGKVIGIHTNAGCSANAGNSGTAIEVGGLQSALANPKGVCIPDASGPVGAPLTSFTVQFGTLTSGTLASLEASDNSYLQVLSAAQGSRFNSITLVEATSPSTNITQLDVSVESSVTGSTGSKLVRIFNFDTNAWVTLGATSLTTTDTVQSFVNIANPNAFVRDSDGRVQLRFMTGSNFGQPQYTNRIDHVAITVTPAESAGTCYADCNGDGGADIMDLLCFQGLFASGSPQADCNADGEVNVFDWLCIQGLVSQGCP